MGRWGYVYNNKLMGGSKMGMHIQSIKKLKQYLCKLGIITFSSYQTETRSKFTIFQNLSCFGWYLDNFIRE